MSDSLMSWEAAVLWLRSQPDQSELVRACFYDDPLEAAAQRYYESTEWEAVRGLLAGRRGRVLDVGAGRGISSYALARDGWYVSALEPDPSSVVGAGAIRSLGSRTGLQIDIVEKRGERLPFEDAGFDLVYCRQALHHAGDLRQLCREIGRVLKPDGILLATREHVISSKSDLPEFLRNHPLHHLYGGENAYTLGEYLDAIEAAGISVRRTLNPLQSDINLFPETRSGIRRRISKRIALPFAAPIPDFALGVLGHFLRQPGRLYTFVGVRRHG